MVHYRWLAARACAPPLQTWRPRPRQPRHRTPESTAAPKDSDVRRRRPSRRPVASGPARGDARQRPSPWRCSGSLIRPGPGPGPRGCDQRLGAAAPVCRASDVTERAGGMSESESAPGSPPSSRHKPKIASRKRGAPAQASRRCIRQASESAGSRAEFIRDRDRDSGVTVTPGPGQILTVTPGPGQTDSGQ